MTGDSVRISYRRSGGLAGLELTADAATDDLPAGQAGVASELLAGSAATERPTPAPLPDGFTYELRLHGGGQERTFRWTDGEVPETVRPLLDTLTQRATPAPRR